MRYSARFCRVVFFFTALAAIFPAYGAVKYVEPNGTGDGTTWEAAGALQFVVSEAEAGDEVWVTEGTYTATTIAVLSIKEGVRVYGGFTGTETIREQRDWTTNTTIINGEYQRRCVIGANDTGMDGFLVTQGSEQRGGGLYCVGMSLAVANCVFQDNEAEEGGAIYCSGGTPVITDCTFSGNTSIYGGAIFGNNSTVTITGSKFLANWVSSSGGAIYNQASELAASKCIFMDNRVYDNLSGGGNGGALCTVSGGASSLTNCILTGNHAVSNGGAICLLDNLTTVTLMNCTLAINKSYTGGGVSIDTGSELYATNTILWRDEADIDPEIHNNSGLAQVTYCCVKGGFSGTGNINEKPILIDAPHNVHLWETSSCLDTGTSDNAPADDLLGNPRPSGAGVDIGAYEGFVPAEDIVVLAINTAPDESGNTFPPSGVRSYVRGETAFIQATGTTAQFAYWLGDLSGENPYESLVMDDNKSVTAVFNNVIRVSVDSTVETPDGLSWETAYPDLQSAMDAAQTGDEIWVKEGTYTSEEAVVLNITRAVHFYGGFSGVETKRYQRNPENHPAIIDGENQRRSVRCTEISWEYDFETPYHTIVTLNYSLDGFAITRGGMALRDVLVEHHQAIISNCIFSNNNANDAKHGGGLLISDSTSVTVRKCVFINNTAVYGSGICAYGGSEPPKVIENCSFFYNTAEYGGGIYNINNDDTIVGCVFIGNNATEGGGIYNDNSSTTIRDCVFTENTAAARGGAIRSVAGLPIITDCSFYFNAALSGGAVDYAGSPQQQTITNCLFRYNNANGIEGQGGALYCESPVAMTNCVFLQNTAESAGGGIANTGYPVQILNCSFTENEANGKGGAVFCVYDASHSGSTITNSIFWNDAASSYPEIYSEDIEGNPSSALQVRYSDIAGGHTGKGNLAADPLFVDPSEENLRLQAGSPCIQAGIAEGAPVTDMLGNTHPLGDRIDMGPYLYQNAPEDYVTLTIHVSPEKRGTTSPPAGAHTCTRGGTVKVTALGNAAMFSHWEGDYTSDQSNATIVMDTDKTITAVFEDNIYYVDASSTAVEPDGRSWDAAFPDIQSAVDELALQPGGGDVWVAAGQYYAPTGALMEVAVVTMQESIRLYGGFAGTETAFEQRDWEANASIINGEKVRRCIVGADNTTLDGFTITRGRADNYYLFDDSSVHFNDIFGGGIYNDGVSMHVENCVFLENYALDAGGALYNIRSTITVENCTFTANGSVSPMDVLGGEGGAAICSMDGELIITNSSFYSNSGYKGAVYSYADQSIIEDCVFSANEEGALSIYYGTVTNCVFMGNKSEESAGAVWASGTLFSDCTFINNTSYGSFGGGAVYGKYITLEDCIFQSNYAGGAGGGVFTEGPSILNRCTFLDNAAWSGGGARCLQFSFIVNCIFRNNLSYGIPEDLEIPFVSQLQQQPGFSSWYIPSLINGGGALELAGGAVVNSVFSDNYTEGYGGAIAGFAAPFAIQNCTITGNSAAMGGGRIMALVFRRNGIPFHNQFDSLGQYSPSLP